MSKRDEINNEIKHLENLLEHLEDEKQELETKIEWYSQLVQMSEADLEDLNVQEGLVNCDKCGELVDGFELNEDLHCKDCQPKYNEDEFDR